MCSIAESNIWSNVSEDHQWAANFDFEMGKRQRRSGDTVEEFSWIVVCPFLFTFLTDNLICSMEGGLLASETLKNFLVDICHLIIAWREDCAIKEVGVRFVWPMKVWIDVVDESRKCVFRCLHAGWEFNGAIVRCICTIPNLQQPLCKLCIL